MAENEKRKNDRKKVALTSYIRKEMPDGGSMLMQFMSKDLSSSGIFVSSEDLSVFDLGEEITLIVDKDKVKYYEGNARIVRSARIFEAEGAVVESGYGLMFLDQGKEFSEMVQSELNRSST